MTTGIKTFKGGVALTLVNATGHPTDADVQSGQELLYSFGGVMWLKKFGLDPIKIAETDPGANVIVADGSVAFAGDQSMGGNKLTNLADPTGDQDAATKDYVDDLVPGSKIDTTAIQRDGSVAFAADQSMASHKLTNVTDPASAQDAATKAYVDAAIAGLSWKQEVRAATTGNITLSGAQTIDGVAVVAGDRVLVKAQTAPAENGIYIAATGAWARSTDAATTAELDDAAVFVLQGTTNAGTAWVQTAINPVVGTDTITWTQFDGKQITAGTGLTRSGNTISAANMANGTIKGRTTAGTGAPEDLSGAQATALLSNVVGDSGSGGTKGLVPAPEAGDAAAGKFLKADGTFAVPGGGGALVLVATQTPGSDVTSVNFSGLDDSDVKEWVLIADWVKKTGGNVKFGFKLNGVDIGNSIQMEHGSAAVLPFSEAGKQIIMQDGSIGNDECSAEIRISYRAGHALTARSHATSGEGAGWLASGYGFDKVLITDITFYADTASCIGAGSEFYLYKIKKA
jgi:hypothetical protein